MTCEVEGLGLVGLAELCHDVFDVGLHQLALRGLSGEEGLLLSWALAGHAGTTLAMSFGGRLCFPYKGLRIE